MFWKNPKRDISPIQATKKTLELGIVNQDCDLNVCRRLRIRNKVNDQLLFIGSLRETPAAISQVFLGQVTMSMFFSIEGLKSTAVISDKIGHIGLNCLDMVESRSRLRRNLIYLWDAG